jgi:hypothetical protein
MMKFDTKRLATLLALLLIVLSSAMAQQRRRTPRANAAPAVAADYFPLRAGDSWTYRHSEGSEFTVKVLKDEKQPDGTLRYLVEIQSGARIQYTYSKPTGWVLLHRTDYLEQEALKKDYKPAKQYLRNPLTVGASWNWAGQDVTGTDASESSQVVGLEWVEVPAGKFHAMKIVSQVSSGGALVTKTYWYAPGVGCVKSSSEAGQIKYGYELTNYSFKK